MLILVIFAVMLLPFGLKFVTINLLKTGLDWAEFDFLETEKLSWNKPINQYKSVYWLIIMLIWCVHWAISQYHGQRPAVIKNVLQCFSKDVEMSCYEDSYFAVSCNKAQPSSV